MRDRAGLPQDLQTVVPGRASGCGVTKGGHEAREAGRLARGYVGPWTSSFILFLSQGYVLRGWVDLTSDKPHTVKKAIKYLEQGAQDTKDVLGLMGKVGNGEGGICLTGPLKPETHLRPDPHLEDEE